MTINLTLIYALIFVASLLLVETLLRAVFGASRSAREVQNRLETLKRTSGNESAYQELLLRRGANEKHRFFRLLRNFDLLYSQSGLELTLQRRIAYLVLLFIAGWLVSAIFISGELVIQMPFALGFALLVSFLYVYNARRRRIVRFVHQLPPSIDIIVRSLNAGHPLVAAIALVAKEMPDPIGSEFGLLSDQLTFGSELDDAMLRMIERVGADELNLLAITVTVQRGTGGNLSEILENLSAMIRDRTMIKAKIRAISAEGRITAMIMSVFPALLFLMIRFLSPSYFEPLWESGYGTIVVVTCLVVMGIGVVILRRLVNFDF